MDKTILVYFSIFLFGWQLSAQNKEIYSGKYELNTNKSGIAKFEYIKGEKDQMIKDGTFSFIYINKDSSQFGKLLKEELEGKYKEDKKSGKWTYIEGQHDIELRDVKNGKLIYDLESAIIEIDANYKDGLPNGNWEYIEKKSSEEDEKVLKSSENLSFKSGYLSGKLKFIYKQNGHELGFQGYLNEEGYMDSTWVIRYLNEEQLIEEIREYKEGFLLLVQRKDEESGLQIDKVEYTTTREKLDILEKGENQFKVSDTDFGLLYNAGYQLDAINYTIQLDGNEQIEAFIRELLKYDNDVYIKDDQFARYPIKTKRFEFPISDTEKKYFELILSDFDSLSEKINLMLGNNALILNKDRTDTLAFAYARYQYLEKKLKKFDYLVQLIRKDEYRYVNEEIFKENGIDFISYTDTISYNYNGGKQQRVLDQRNQLKDIDSFLEKVKVYLALEKKRTFEFTTAMLDHLRNLEIDNNISELDEQLTKKKELTLDLYRNAHYLSNAHESLLRSVERRFINEQYEQLYKQYDRASDYVEKVQIADDILQMLNSLDRRFDDFVRVFEKHDEIDDLYYENIFNAFTFSSYDQRAKERLYKAGNEKLFTHYLEQIEGESNYKNITIHLQKIDKLQNRMMELRDEDTNKMERKLRRNNLPSQIENLLGLE